jgi:hypothetical protein
MQGAASAEVDTHRPSWHCSPFSPRLQGRYLNTPELVPFRLTRDVVDGMGVTGVEGVMRRCCEETLRVRLGAACAVGFLGWKWTAD